MTKNQAIRLLRAKNQSGLGRVLGVSRQTVSQWKEIMTERQEKQVLGQAIMDRFDVDEFIEIIMEL